MPQTINIVIHLKTINVMRASTHYRKVIAELINRLDRYPKIIRSEEEAWGILKTLIVKTPDKNVRIKDVEWLINQALKHKKAVEAAKTRRCRSPRSSTASYHELLQLLILLRLEELIIADHKR
ncbi:MAG: hypothetical protein WCF67_20900 [Chitinophagaceae bacterium]